MTQPHSDPQPLSDFLSHPPRPAPGPQVAHSVAARVEDDGAATPAGPAYIALGTALAKGDVLVDEVDESGSVPHVRVTNMGDVAVLFLFGEEIRGAKQNRVANASFLVPEKSDVVLDVSCVEAGRWNRASGARFEGSDEMLAPSLRRKMSQERHPVTRSRRELLRRPGRGVGPDQRTDPALGRRVWDPCVCRLSGQSFDGPRRAEEGLPPGGGAGWIRCVHRGGGCGARGHWEAGGVRGGLSGAGAGLCDRCGGCGVGAEAR